MNKKSTVKADRAGRVAIDLNLHTAETAPNLGPVRPADFRLAKKHGQLFGQDGGDGAVENYGQTENYPRDITDRIELARGWHEKNQFLQRLREIKIHFFNSRFAIKSVEGSKAANAAVKEWHYKNRVSLRRCALAVWEDRLSVDNVVAFWRSSSNPPRIWIIPAERCRYTDSLGLEKMQINPGWKATDFATAQAALAQRYAGGGYITVSEARGENYRVLRRCRDGWGFGNPRLQAIHRTLEQEESLEVADNLWSFVGRTVLRQFKVGHEIRQGPMAGRSNWFYTEEIGKALRDFFEGRLGIVDFPTNFDIEVLFPYPEGKRFDKSRYESVLQRLSLWGGPAGAMLLTGDLALAGLLQEEAHAEREDVGPFLEEIFTEVFKPPGAISVVWGDKCFRDQRIWAEMIKLAFTSGAASQTTVLREAGLDPFEERENKAEEAALPKAEVLPIYDPAHGPGGALGSPASNGRPAGVKDAGPRG